MGEEALIGWLRGRLREDNLLGDDAALVPVAGAERWAISVDTQIEGVHFFPGFDPASLARRLLAVNLSDLAAMGAEPDWCVLALAAPKGFDHRRFFEVFVASAEAVGLELVGGDLASSSVVTAVLTLAGKKAGRRFVERQGARAGHRLWLGGEVGVAALGLALQERDMDANDLPTPWQQAAQRALRRHLEPVPQLELGAWLGDRSEGGGLDVSDGVAKDLARLCAESAVGAEVDEARLPMPADCAGLARHLGLDPIALALAGGEDYVLLFTLPAGEAPPPQFQAVCIGRITAGSELVRVAPNGNRRPLSAVGFDHLAV